MSRVRRRQGARQDLVEIAYHLIRRGSPVVGRRFREVVESAFLRLAAMPDMGTRYAPEHPAFGELRYFPIPSRFKNYVVFYRPAPDGIEVVRVLHGARDLDGILSDEFGVARDEDE